MVASVITSSVCAGPSACCKGRSLTGSSASTTMTSGNITELSATEDGEFALLEGGILG